MSLAPRLAPLVLLAACALPAPDDLHGTWAEVEDGTVRAWVFHDTLDEDWTGGLPHVFEIYVYDEGAEPVRRQGGTYDIDEVPLTAADDAVRPALLQQVQWAEDGAQLGAFYGNEIHAWSPRRLVLGSDSADDGKRTFLRVDDLP